MASEAEELHPDTRWLAMLVRDGLLLIVRGIERRCGLKRDACPRCGHERRRD